MSTPPTVAPGSLEVRGPDPAGPAGSTAAPARPPAPAGRRAPHPILLRVHVLVGIIIAPFLFVQCLTGLAYVFTPQLNDLIHSRELLVGPHSGPPRLLDEQVAAAVAGVPEAKLLSATVSDDPERTTAVSFAVPGLPTGYNRTVYVDPYTAQVRGTFDTFYGEPPVQNTLRNLHGDLLLGPVGRVYSELSASWLPVLVLFGLALWIARRRADRRSTAVASPPGPRTPMLARMARHRVVGITLSLALLIMAATGLNWSQFAAPQLQSTITAPMPQFSGGKITPGPGADIGPGAALAVARGADLVGPLTVSVPKGPDGAYTVAEAAKTWPVQRDRIAVHPQTGEITSMLPWASYSAGAKLTTIAIMLHTGSLFGWVSQVALAAMAVGVLLLIGWGYRLAWTRRPRRGDSGRITLDGAPARPVRRVTLLVMVVAVAAYTWIAPVFGISLVAFLLLDRVLGLIRTRRTA